MVEITLGRTRKSAKTCLTCVVTKTNEHVTTSLEKSNALPIYFHVMLINISWFQWNYFWLAHTWNSPRDCHIFLFCHSSLFFEGLLLCQYYISHQRFPSGSEKFVGACSIPAWSGFLPSECIFLSHLPKRMYEIRWLGWGSTTFQHSCLLV